MAKHAEPMSADVLGALVATISARAAASADRSYTRQLLDSGPEKCARKFGEEALELMLAAVGPSARAVETEAADVVYHLLVLLAARGVSFDKVLEELHRRTQQSGVDEKASRG